MDLRNRLDPALERVRESLTWGFALFRGRYEAPASGARSAPLRFQEVRILRGHMLVSPFTVGDSASPPIRYHPNSPVGRTADSNSVAKRNQQTPIIHTSRVIEAGRTPHSGVPRDHRFPRSGRHLPSSVNLCRYSAVTNCYPRHVWIVTGNIWSRLSSPGRNKASNGGCDGPLQVRPTWRCPATASTLAWLIGTT